MTSHPCLKVSTGIRGRGVFASESISPSTVIETSPVLLFSKEEYQLHGKFTLLDHYTFNWPDGRMALALGLGSLFNHSNTPNVSFMLDTENECIKYRTVKPVSPGEELCIFYGHMLWFELAEGTSAPSGSSIDEETPDPFAELLGVDNDQNYEEKNPFSEGNPEDVLAEEDLPFRIVKLPPEEEEVETVRTMQVWAADITEPRFINSVLKWLQKARLDVDELDHLRRIRKQADKASVLITAQPELPEDLPAELGTPYTVQVPVSAALTMPSLNAKLHFWPTLYTPRRKDAVPDWTRGQVSRAWTAMRDTIQSAQDRKEGHRDLPIVARVPVSFADDGPANSPSFVARDTRSSEAHPLRHATLDLIKQVASWRAIQTDQPLPAEPTSQEPVQNGTNYLLTNQTFFTTHEPCIMCSMALLHSRVKEVHYLMPMDKTGGCGGAACLPALPGVNHRFRIYVWDSHHFADMTELEVDGSVDA